MTYRNAIEAEVARWRGASVTFERTSKHQRALISYAERVQFVVFPTSPSDSKRGQMECLTDVRAALKALGAEREKVAKRTAPPRERNKPDRFRLPSELATPKDPWASLRGAA